MVIAHYFHPCLHRKLGEKGEVKRCGKIKFGKGMIAVVDKSIVRKIVIIIKEIDLIKKQYISYRDKEKVCDRRTPPLKVAKTNSLQNFSPLRRQCLKR